MGAQKEKMGQADHSPASEEVHKCCGCRFPLLIALLQLLLGIAVAVVAFIMAAISPSLLARETPHWAGIIVSMDSSSSSSSSSSYLLLSLFLSLSLSLHCMACRTAHHHLGHA